jgi:hypothetical protein
MAFMPSERRREPAGCSAMKPSSQYREFAADCLRLARSAKSEDERLILLEMAATWRSLAEEAGQQNPMEEH